MPGKNDQLAGNIIATVATAESVLVEFRDSLVRSGFSEGAVPYTRLADTLIAQRLWVESSGMAEQARFTAVGSHAREIADLLQPYLDAFQRLSVLTASRLTENDDDAPAGEEDAAAQRLGNPAEAPDEAGAAILRALDDAGRPLSFTALRDATRLPRAELTAALDALTGAGHIQRTRASGRELFRSHSTP